MMLRRTPQRAWGVARPVVIGRRVRHLE